MPIFSMLARSMISYSVFLASRKIVKGGIGLGEGFKKNLQLHRCDNCWRLYSGEIVQCDFCGEFTKPTYNVYKDSNYGPYDNSEEFEKRDGLERQVYNDSRNFKFEPLKPREIKNEHRESSRDNTEPSGSNQGRGRDSDGNFGSYNDRGGQGSPRGTKLREVT